MAQDAVSRTLKFFSENGLEKPERRVLPHGEKGYTIHDALEAAFFELGGEKFAQALITTDPELAAWGLYAAYPRLKPQDVRRITRFIGNKKDTRAAGWLLDRRILLAERDLWWLAKTAGRLTQWGFPE